MFLGGFFFLLFIALIGASFAAFDLPRPFYLHGVFVLAALPLMWAAMLHFVSVLTRSGGAARGMRALPWAAMLLAFVLLAVFAGRLPRHALLLPALLIGGGAAAMLVWAGRRGRRAFGRPHPGLRWYLAALGLLMLGLTTVFGMVFDGARYAVWYGLHLHLNLLGWVGLTVLGTLPVLLPTSVAQGVSPPGAAGHLRKIEPNATFRLQVGLPWAVSGVLAIALSAALRLPVLGAFGALALLALIAAHWRAWLGFYGAPWHWPGPAVSLLLGSGFLGVLLLVGMAHGFGLIGGALLLPAFAAGFLLPTVLGALAQLLPVWRFPGPDSPARQAFARVLSRGAAVRGGCCVLAGLGQLFALGPSLLLAGFAALWLLVSVPLALRRARLAAASGTPRPPATL